MKVNYDFYTGKDTYCDGEVEKDIINYLEKYGEKNYKKIFEQDISWPVFYHITPIRKNILKWYEFKENAEVLEIGAGMGAITGILCDKAAHVTSVELSKQRASAIQARCKDKDNLEIIVGNFNDIKFEKKFDYITLIGVLEYAPLYTNSKNPFEDFLKTIKKLLKPDGKLLIAIENQFGMKYFTGAEEDHTGKVYDGITGYENKKGIRTFGKNQLKDILKNAGFEYNKFYYPMPDYKLPNIIFSDEYLPDKQIMEEYTPYLSNENSEVEYDEKQAYIDIIKNNQFGFFANSFFIEASEQEIDTKIDLLKQDLVKIDDSMKEFYNKHYKISAGNIKSSNVQKIVQEAPKDIEEKKLIANTRKNIINWYPFNKESSVLEINIDTEEITNELKNKVNSVTTINDIEENSEIVNKKFDYIILIGLEEYEFSLKQYLEFAQKHLKENGKILFACNNKYGLNTYNTDCEKVIEKKLISKNEIEKELKGLNIENYKFYYPLPNYKYTNVIFTDKYLPNNESIQRDFTLYTKKEILGLEDEREKYKEIIEEDKQLFKFFANSYLVEVSNTDNKINFVSFNNSRKDEYKIKTVMREDIVYKQSVDEKGDIHFNNIKKNLDILNELDIKTLDTYENNTIFSKLMQEENSLDKILIKKIEDGYIDEAINIMKEFEHIIKEKLLTCNKEGQTVFEKYNIEIDENTNQKLNYTKYGFFDLIFQNCFYINNEFYFYDQEWLEENIPVEFIIYRAIEYLGNLSKKINKHELLKEFNLLEFLEPFEKLEQVLQSNIKNKDIWNIHALNKTTVKNVYDTQIHYQNLNAILEQKNVEEKNQDNFKIEEMKNEILRLTNELNIIKSSKSWKMAEKLRKIRKKL